jgi:hypothetical protein
MTILTCVRSRRATLRALGCNTHESEARARLRAFLCVCFVVIIRKEKSCAFGSFSTNLSCCTDTRGLPVRVQI